MDIKKELDEIMNDDLLKCKIVNTKENELIRVDIVLWCDNTFSVYDTDKISGSMTEHEIGESYKEAKRVFDSFIA